MMEAGIIGKVIDTYKITAVLGKGGMGVVYKAQDMTLDRDVALKMMDMQLAADQNFLKRFQSEAKALAKLQNPGIVAIFALRETELGLCIVMEYVDGQTLADVIRERGPVPLGETISLFKQILSALDHAHRAGIIHRDIKPSNVMITPDGTVKVADFGLAKIQQTSAVTVTVGTGGTLYYMSPEQVRGLANVDHRGDIYSLGMTLYEAVVGRVPFEMSDTDYSIRQSIVEGKIPSPDKFKPDLPKDLVRVVMKAMEKDPANRYQSASAMIDALQKLEPKHDLTKERRAGDTGTVIDSMPGKRKPKAVIIVTAVIATAAVLFYVGRLFLAPSTAMLSISTTPSGALIIVNGQSIGLSPAEYRAEPGTVALQFLADGFTPRDTSLVVKKGDVLSLAIAMAKGKDDKGSGEKGERALQKAQTKDEASGRKEIAPLTATLVLQAVPSGSIAVDNNIKAGNTSRSQEVQVDAGDRIVTFQHPVYGPASFPVTVRAGETKKLICYFESYVSVQSLAQAGESVWGSIMIDGKDTGIQTPKDRIPLSPGKHLVTVTRAGYETVEGTKELVIQPTLGERVIPLVFHLRKK